MKKLRNKDFSKISKFAIFSFVFVILGIACVLCSIFLTGRDMTVIFDSTELNPLVSLFKHPSEFLADSKNIVFIVFFFTGLFFLYLGCVVLPLINVINVTKVDEKSLFKPTFFTTPIVLVWLPFFPVVWLISIFTTISKATAFAKLNVPDTNQDGRGSMNHNRFINHNPGMNQNSYQNSYMNQNRPIGGPQFPNMPQGMNMPNGMQQGYRNQPGMFQQGQVPQTTMMRPPYQNGQMGPFPPNQRQMPPSHQMNNMPPQQQNGNLRNKN